MSSQVSLISLS